MCSINQDIELDEHIITVTFTVSKYTIENDGIGKYEFWGRSGYDKGVDYRIAEEISYDITPFSLLEQDYINNYIKENKENLLSKLTVKLNEEIYD